MSVEKPARMGRARFIQLMSAAAFTGLMAACGSQEAPTPKAEPTKAPEPTAVTKAPAERKRIVLTVFSATEELINAIKKFNASQEQITVDFYALSAGEKYLPSLTVLHNSGSQMDAMIINGDNFVDVVRLGLLTDLTDKVKFFDRFNEEVFYDFFAIDGKRYVIPYNIGYTMGWYVNQVPFDKNQLKMPTTYEEFKEAGKALTANGVTPYLFYGQHGPGWSTMVWYFLDQLVENKMTTFMYDTLAGRVKFTDPRWVEGFNMGVQFERDGLLGKDFWNRDIPAVTAQFSVGKGGIVNGGSWDWPDYAKAQAEHSDVFQPKWAAPIQVVNGAKRRVIVAPGSPMGVYAGSKHVDEAIQFLDYLSSDELALETCKVGKTTLTMNKNVKAPEPADNPFMPQMREDFAQGFIFPDWQAGIKLTSYMWSDQFAQVVAKKLTAQEALANIQKYQDSQANQ